MAARVSLHEVLRALVRGDRALLHDAEWVARAVQAIDEHEAATEPAALTLAPSSYQASPDGTITPPGVA